MTDALDYPVISNSTIRQLLVVSSLVPHTERAIRANEGVTGLQLLSFKHPQV